MGERSRNWAYKLKASEQREVRSRNRKMKLRVSTSHSGDGSTGLGEMFWKQESGSGMGNRREEG